MVTTDKTKELEELTVKFNALCDEQEKLPREGFAKVFEVLDGMEDTFTPQHPYTENEDIINKALEITGHSNDETFCKAFKRNNQIMIEGKKIQAKGLEILAMQQYEKAKEEPPSPDEWQFMPIRIFAPKEIISDIINPILEGNAKEGKGFYEVKTNIPEEDESMDDWFEIEAYGIRCSLEPIYRELQDYGIFNDNVLGDQIIKKYYLTAFKMLVHSIRDNTDRPNRVRNIITNTLKDLDRIQAVGLVLQILLLQSLFRWLDEIDLKEDEEGYKSACLLAQWIGEQLAKKEVDFCCYGWGEEDKKQLKPFCEYLLSTEIGKAVQKHLFGKQIDCSCIIDGENEAKEIPQKTKAAIKQYITKPQPEHPEQQQKIDKPTRGKGRPKETLKDKMINDADGNKLQKVHIVMNDKKGKDAALIILACIKKGWMQKPTFTQVAEEFGDIGKQQGFTKYLKESYFTKDEIEGAINSLD
ncbi:hypothetical protein MUN53_17365 [Parabacteroides sp. AGMB00274]|uniref:Uncharacterized protein n=1 Tax=Parabacteroides faecalis TaxID=2924040 RepID=A0ABT0C5S2_9BACT|nr:hypothetical protein [Parabacteroides faecalis]MCJ2382354.1 hypothetical protein [Parabacteroides faecalis]MDY6254136.1 hypothetical protein [Bacteroidales bacterium]